MARQQQPFYSTVHGFSNVTQFLSGRAVCIMFDNQHVRDTQRQIPAGKAREPLHLSTGGFATPLISVFCVFTLIPGKPRRKRRSFQHQPLDWQLFCQRQCREAPRPPGHDAARRSRPPHLMQGGLQLVPNASGAYMAKRPRIDTRQFDLPP